MRFIVPLAFTTTLLIEKVFLNCGNKSGGLLRLTFKVAEKWFKMDRSEFGDYGQQVG